MRSPTRALTITLAASALAVAGCGTPPVQNAVPPWQQLTLGEKATMGGFEVAAYAVEGNAAEVELCYASREPGSVGKTQWWVWTDGNRKVAPTELQERQPVYADGEKAECHRGWIQFDLKRGEEITHVNYAPGSKNPSEFTWITDPA